MAHIPASTGWNRREFMASVASGTLAGSALSLPGLARTQRRLIVLLMVGGPSQIDTWDPKLEAPAEVRGPFRTIRTAVPGIHLAETFPRMAAQADQYTLIRSVHHTHAPVHETGLQILQTGQLAGDVAESPHHGARLAAAATQRHAGWLLLPEAIESTGIRVSHGQGAGSLGSAAAPLRWTDAERDAAWRSEPAALRERYGAHPFGQNCLLARQAIEAGHACVTVNMFRNLFDELSWDCHADGGSLRSTLEDYQRTLCPMFDQAYTALLTDLRQRGLLDETLVVAMGEFGRTPYLNPRGGRDHWTGVWTIALAGGGMSGGQVIGASDRLGGEPKEQPMTAEEVAQRIQRQVGLIG